MQNKDILKRCERELRSSSSLDMLKVAKNYCDLFILSLHTNAYWANKYRQELQQIYNRQVNKWK